MWVSQSFCDVSQTLFAHVRPQALQRDFGPAGPRRIIGVEFLLVPQLRQLHDSDSISCNN